MRQSGYSGIFIAVVEFHLFTKLLSVLEPPVSTLEVLYTLEIIKTAKTRNDAGLNYRVSHPGQQNSGKCHFLSLKS